MSTASSSDSERRQSRDRRWKRIFCPHCGEVVSKTTYYRHRQEHYDKTIGKWKKRERAAVPASSETEVECDCPGELSAEDEESESMDIESGGEGNRELK